MSKNESETANHSDSSKPSLFVVWSKYEDIAMHFNDLVIRVRFQALAGVAALIAGISIIFDRPGDEPNRWLLMAVSFGVLNVLWVALAALDFLYYNRLLLGAVDAIINLEKISQSFTTVEQIDLSTFIKREVEHPLEKWRKSLRGPAWFYSIVFLCLFSLMLLSLYRYLKC